MAEVRRFDTSVVMDIRVAQVERREAWARDRDRGRKVAKAGGGGILEDAERRGDEDVC